MKKYLGYFFAGAAIYFGFAGLGYAETTVSAEVQYIFNTLLFLMSGFLVMWMAAGFAMLESGLVTSKSVSAICAKNIGLYSIAGVMFWLVGYNLAYGIPEGGYIGSFTPWSDNSSLETGYSDGSDWFFQMVFCATTMSIVSGTLAERIKIWPFFLFAAILTGIIYPISMGWQWGGGWLSVAGFSDFAGSTLVHAAGGAAALAGAIVLGARSGRFSGKGEAKPINPELSKLVEKANKMLSETRKYPGSFKAERVILPMFNEAVYALQEDVVQACDVDVAMKYGCGLKRGLLTIASDKGLAHCLEELRDYQGALGERFRPSWLMTKLVRAGVKDFSKESSVAVCVS